MYKYDQRTSFGTAYIFFQVAKQCLEQEKLSEHIIFVSATNYGSAVELFLKTILIIKRVEIPHIHDLFELYCKLDNEIRELIKQEYNKNCGNHEKQAFYIRGVTSKNPRESFKQSIPPPAPQDTLEEILKNSKKIFIDFRYMFDKARSENVEYYNLQHECLDILCNVLIDICKKYDANLKTID